MSMSELLRSIAERYARWEKLTLLASAFAGNRWGYNDRKKGAVESVHLSSPTCMAVRYLTGGERDVREIIVKLSEEEAGEVARTLSRVVESAAERLRLEIARDATGAAGAFAASPPRGTIEGGPTDMALR